MFRRRMQDKVRLIPSLSLSSAALTPARIKRRSAFMKHLKAKHDIDLNMMSIEEAATAANLIRASPDAERVATPPPDYTTATKEPTYKEEDLPTFSSNPMPKEEAHTPLSVTVTPPPPVIDVVPSTEGYQWSSTGFGGTFHLRITSFVLLLIGHIMQSCTDPAALGAGVVYGSPEIDLQSCSQPDVGCYFYPDILSQQPPSYYEPQWSETSVFTPSPLSVASVASVDALNSSSSPCVQGAADYTFGYDPNNYGVLSSQISSSRDATSDMHAYMTPAPMTSFSAYSFA